MSSIAQAQQLNDLSRRVVAIESNFRDAAEVGNTRERLDNLESTMSGVLLELQRLSKALANNEAGKDPQGAQCQNSLQIGSAQSLPTASAEASRARTQNSGASAKMR